MHRVIVLALTLLAAGAQAQTLPQPSFSGLRIAKPVTHGFFDNSAAACIQANTTELFQGRCYVMAFDPPSTISQYGSRDSVGLVVTNTGVPYLAFRAGTFTATTFVPAAPLPAATVAKLRVGMLIDSNVSSTVWQINQNRWTGQITGWAANGSSITVSGWYRQTTGPTPSPATTPTGVAAAAINPSVKVFGQNTNVFIPENFYGNAAGFELGMFNAQSAATSETSFPNFRMFDAVNLGPLDITNGYIFRAFNGDAVSAFTAAGGRAFGFHDMPVNQSAGRIGFMSEITQGNAFAIRNPVSGAFPFLVNAAGTMTVQNVGTATLAVAGQQPPSSKTAACVAGTIVPGNDGYIYVCIYSGNWGRAALGAW